MRVFVLCAAALVAETAAFAPSLAGRAALGRGHPGRGDATLRVSVGSGQACAPAAVNSRMLRIRRALRQARGGSLGRASPAVRAGRVRMEGAVDSAQQTAALDKLDGLAKSLDGAVERGAKPSAAEEGAVGKDQFIFTKQWYPVAVVEFLDKKKPHPLQLMGKDLVMWLDVTTNKWNVFEDACPHRLAPLSEGRIEPDGTLLCTYHAWRFNARGECTSIPHARKEREAELCVRYVEKSAPVLPLLGTAVQRSAALTHGIACRRSPRRVLSSTPCKRRRGSCGCGGSLAPRAATQPSRLPLRRRP